MHKNTPPVFFSCSRSLQGGAGVNGPIVLWVDPISAALLPSPSQYKDVYGVSFTTTFTAANLVRQGTIM